jgi:tRNA(fMet)-specific endonuclease VapC
MLRTLLDTYVANFVIRQRLPQTTALINRQAGRMAVSAITLAELMHGAEKSRRPAANLAVVEDFCSRLEVLPYGPKAAQHDGQDSISSVTRAHPARSSRRSCRSGPYGPPWPDGWRRPYTRNLDFPFGISMCFETL